MTHVTERDALVTRRRILEEFEEVETEIATNPESWRKLSFEAHKKICETMGDDFIDYPEFEFWFSRFLQGNFNLYHDRRSDSKTRSFTDLPSDVFKNLGEYLELKDRMRLRNVCKDIRDHIDSWDPKMIAFSYFNANYWSLYHKSRCEPYTPHGIEGRELNRFVLSSTRKPISFLVNILKLPKLQLEELTVFEEDDCWKELIRELDESSRKLHVKKVGFPFRRDSCYKIDIHYIVPGVLRKIIVSMEKPSFEVINELVETDQCQSAEMLSFNNERCASKFPLEALYNCPRFTLKLGGEPADDLMVEFIKKLIQDGKVERCALRFANERKLPIDWFCPTRFMKYFNEPNTMDPNSPWFSRYDIKFIDRFVCLERKQ